MADGPPAHDDHGQALALATRLHATGDCSGALELLPDLVAARPDDGTVRLLLARCLATAGAPAVALAAADAAMACDPTSWEAHAVLAQAALNIDPERATAAAERAVQLAPGEPEALRAHAAVRSALAETPTTDDGSRRRPAAALGALGRRPSAPAPAPTDEPRLTPRLPAALAGVTPDGPAPTAAPPPAPTPGAPAEMPSATPAPPAAPAGGAPILPVPATPIAPAPTTPAPGEPAGAPPAAPTGPDGTRTDARREPLLPKALGGTGLPGTDDDAPAPADRLGAGRLAVRVIGLVAWLVVGFRIGVQGIGGPVGIALFVAVLAWVAFLARRLTQR